MIPAILHGVILRSFKRKMTHDDARREARFISVAIAIAIILLFTGPHIVWKFMGQKRATELVKRWESEDARLRSPGEFVPVWTVHLPGYLSTSTVRCCLSSPSVPGDSHICSALGYHNSLQTRLVNLSSRCVHTLGMIPPRLLSSPLVLMMDSGLTALLILAPPIAFLQLINATSNRLRTVRSHYTEITARHFHRTSVTATRTRRLAPGLKPIMFSRNWGFLVCTSKARTFSLDHLLGSARGPHVMARR